MRNEDEEEIGDSDSDLSEEEEDDVPDRNEDNIRNMFAGKNDLIFYRLFSFGEDVGRFGSIEEIVAWGKEKQVKGLSKANVYKLCQSPGKRWKIVEESDWHLDKSGREEVNKIIMQNRENREKEKNSTPFDESKFKK